MSWSLDETEGKFFLNLGMVNPRHCSGMPANLFSV